jgi:hypothetical protein
MKKNDQFWKSFIAKGRMGSLLSNIPLYIVKHKQVGLLGAQVICRRWFRTGTHPTSTRLPPAVCGVLMYVCV